jgi:lipoprotein-releasing system ATP-binding protein
MLSCVDLAKTYASERGEIDAVKGIDIAVRPGEFTSIVGRSGSGKSSFLAMIGGLSRPSRGMVRTRTPISGV